MTSSKGCLSIVQMFLRGFFKRTLTMFEMCASVALAAPTFPCTVNALASEEAVATGSSWLEERKVNKIR